MSLAKAVISGTVFKAPQKRFTTNNVPITSFTLNISDNDQILIRVIAKGNLAELIDKTVSLSDKVVVEGRLQNATVKADDGSEKRIVEIDMNGFEKLSGTASADGESIVKFAQEDFSDDLIGEEELPF